jgi:hypothetical protein
MDRRGSAADGGRGCWGRSPLVGGSLARCLLRGSAPARAAAATLSAPATRRACTRCYATR